MSYVRYPPASGSGGVISLNALTGAIDLIAGANVTITPGVGTITISTTGVFSRSINLVAVSTTAGAVADTDYFYLASGTTTITLPTAVGNTNLYTVKNVGVDTVTVDTTSSQTIDGSLTAPMPVPNTSLTFISDGTNWNVI